MKDVITLRGERDEWIDFIHKAKKEKKKAWDVLSPFLRKYISADEETRVLLILFPKDLVEELMREDDADAVIRKAIKEHLAKGK